MTESERRTCKALKSLPKLEYRDWDLKARVESKGVAVQWNWVDECSRRGVEGMQLSELVTVRLIRWDETIKEYQDKIIKEAFALLLRALYHEAGEFFKVGDLRLFDPHKALEW